MGYRWQNENSFWLLKIISSVCEKRRKRLNELKESIAKIENDPNDPKSKRRLTILVR